MKKQAQPRDEKKNHLYAQIQQAPPRLRTEKTKRNKRQWNKMILPPKNTYH
jgi:hypothetical protein